MPPHPHKQPINPQNHMEGNSTLWVGEKLKGLLVTSMNINILPCESKQVVGSYGDYTVVHASGGGRGNGCLVTCLCLDIKRERKGGKSPCSHIIAVVTCMWEWVIAPCTTIWLSCLLWSCYYLHRVIWGNPMLMLFSQLAHDT